MSTRREILRGAMGAGALAGARTMFAKAAQPSTAVNFDVPPHTCDCHTHIFGDFARFPLSPERVYTPETAVPEEMSMVHRALHVERVVIVTPSVYGPDNSATLYGMKARGKNARGVAVIGDKTPESELDAMGKAGIRGVRINATTAGGNDPAAVGRQLQKLTDRVKPRGWHIQFYTNLAVIAGIKDQVLQSPVPIVFDHFGGAQASLGVDQPGFSALVELVRSGRAYVKISGAYLSSKRAPDFGDVMPMAKALIAANVDRVLWGTDWPHPESSVEARKPPSEVTPLRQIDDGLVMNQFALWAPDPAVRKKILVDNPVRLYGF